MRKLLALFVGLMVCDLAGVHDSLLTFAFQATTLSQVHPQFHSPYVGDDSLQLSPDYQCAGNPAYNGDRGQANIFSLRTNVAIY